MHTLDCHRNIYPTSVAPVHSMYTQFVEGVLNCVSLMLMRTHIFIPFFFPSQLSGIVMRCTDGTKGMGFNAKPKTRSLVKGAHFILVSRARSSYFMFLESSQILCLLIFMLFNFRYGTTPIYITVITCDGCKYMCICVYRHVCSNILSFYVGRPLFFLYIFG